jgi:GR25 family glycosyltransferase involved in LPS biosynthesis
MVLHPFDGVVYINLSHRKDRNQLLLEELSRLEIAPYLIHRIDAIHDFLNGHRGCAQSHYLALEFAQKKGWKNVLVLEDDMQFTKSKEEVKQEIDTFFQHFTSCWDVFFLAANVFESCPTDHPSIKKVLCAQCAHAYAVNQHYFSTLQRCFQEAYQAMQDDEYFVDSLFKAIDQRWKTIQPQGRWYIGQVLGQQRRSYSDIEHVIRKRHHETV